MSAARYCPHWGTWRAPGDELEPTTRCTNPAHDRFTITTDQARRIVSADRARRRTVQARARQRRARIAARWLILAAFLAALGIAGHVEGLTP